MISESLTAVALPAGLSQPGPGSAGRPRASIYLTPRLSGAHLLSAFPDWLDWTRLVRRHGITFTLACAGSSTTVAADLAPLRPDIWQAIFRHDSLVEEYQAPDFTRRLLVSYPARDAQEFVRSAYQLASTVPAGAAIRELRELLSSFVFRDGNGRSTIDETLSQLRVDLWTAQQNSGEPGTHSLATQALPTGTRALAERFALYHHLPPAPGRPPLPGKPAELARLIDFHQALTSLTGYPSLLPVLGLVFPVELPPDFCPASPAAGAYRTVRVTAVTPGWTWTHAPALASPATGYVRGQGRFCAAPATPPGGSPAAADVIDGFLALRAADFSLAGVDLDGALLKVMALADSLANAERLDGEQTPLADGLLPALRSSGLSLLADNRAQQLLQAIKDNLGFLSGAATRPLNARDVTRGYRIDVYSDRRQAWQSLHRRDGTYRFGGGLAVQTEDEEGFTQLAVVQPADDPHRPTDQAAAAAGAPQPGTDLYVNERVARWNGWSLSAPRPGTPLNRDPDPARALDADPTAGQPVTTFDMTTSFAVHPGTLPQLRFGARYRVRARAVDLAGHSVPLSATVPDQLVAPADGEYLPYYRYEPVSHPLLVLRAEPGPGGSLAQLVIRTFNSDPSLDTVPARQADERHVAPPRAAVAMAEHHGLLDDRAGYLRGDAATYQQVVERDAAQVPVTVPGPGLSVTYLPDPLARGAAFTSLPQATAVVQVPFGGTWPELVPFRIRLAEGAAAPEWDGPSRVLTVSLPKGAVAATRLSCYVQAGDLDLLGVWNWIRELFDQANQRALLAPDAGPEAVGTAERQGQLTQAVLDGGNEFITPSLPVSLTHAVQQPLGRPEFTLLPVVHSPVTATLADSFSPLIAWRSLGSHHAVLLGALRINGATTAAVDLEARWIDWNDDITEPGPTRRQGSGPVERISLASLDGGTIPADGAGTRQVAVYLPGIDTLWFAAPFDQLAGAPAPVQLAAPVHVFHDTRHRTVRYRAVSSSRFQEYFPEPGTVTKRTGPALTVDVPSSARPVPPDIASVIPTFGWDRQVSTSTKTEIRQGNALRVYLRRPWYSSGAGELLGVVLWPAASGQPPTDDQLEAGKTTFTQWGLDPIWASGPLADVPATAAFPAASRSAASLTLHETTQLVDVAGHDVSYDPARQLWYCDIEFDNPAAYAPFVRLALARYQPRSIPGTELSQVALADFAQLTPDRSASLTVDPADPRAARLVVAGLAPDGPTESFLTATVETRRADIGSDLGWQVATPGEVRVVEDSPPPGQPGSVLYSATIRFAARPAPGTFRLVVREFEVLRIDPPPTALSDKPEFGTRLVYASILPFDYPLDVEVA